MASDRANSLSHIHALNSPLESKDPSGHWIESALDVAFIVYDIYDIQQNGLNWENGLSLVADVGGLALPIVTGGGLAVRAVAHADEAADAVRAAHQVGNAAQAVANANRLREVGAHTDEGIQLVMGIAEQSTRGSGNLVIIGQHIPGAGYIAEAQRLGAVYFATAGGVFDALGKSDELAWAINEQFLKNQLESGRTIHLFGELRKTVLDFRGSSFTAREVRFLDQFASQYGYIFDAVSNSWIKTQ